MLPLAIASFLAFASLPDHFIDNHPILENTWWGEFIHDFDEKMGYLPYLPNWDNLLYQRRLFAIEEVIRVAESDPMISYFFWVTGLDLRIEDSSGEEHNLVYGDCLFFTGDQPKWTQDRKGLLYYRTTENR